MVDLRVRDMAASSALTGGEKFYADNGSSDVYVTPDQIAAYHTARSTLTIAAGVITVSAPFHLVDTEAAAAFDTLDTITAGVDGQKVVLSLANTTRRVFLSNAGNLVLGNLGTSGFLLWSTSATIELMYDSGLAKWHEVSRFEGRAYEGVKNVKDYGAVGDGTNDDTAAIQAAIDDTDAGFNGIYQSNLNLGTIFFPAGTYKTTSAINVDGTASIRFLGEGCARISGSFNGYLFQFSGGFNYATHSFENLNLNNANSTNGTSGCVDLTGSLNFLFKNCIISTGGGVGVNQGTGGGSTGTLLNCLLIASNEPGGVGFFASNGSAVIECEVIGWAGAGLRHGSIGLNIIGGRWEVNDGPAIQLGATIDGSFGTSNDVHISGLSMESNAINLHIQNGNGVVVSGCVLQSFEAGCTHGLLIESGQNITIENCGISGGFDVAGILVNTDASLQVGPITISNTRATNLGSGVDWIVDDNVDTTSWVNTNYTPAFTNRYTSETRGASNVLAPVTATISSGVITVAGNYMVIDTQASAASDDLDTISGAVYGQHGSRLVLRAANSARTVIVKDGTGNIQCAGDMTLDNVQDTIQLIWDGELNAWLELGRSNNGV